jgi:hypothetical protein
MKIDNIKEEVTHCKKKPQKKEWNRNPKHNGRPLQTEKEYMETISFTIP